MTHDHQGASDSDQQRAHHAQTDRYVLPDPVVHPAPPVRSIRPVGDGPAKDTACGAFGGKSRRFCRAGRASAVTRPARLARVKPRPAPDWRALLAVVLGHVVRRGAGRLPDLRLPAEPPDAKSACRTRTSATWSGLLGCALLPVRSALHPAVGRLGRQVQPQGGDHPQRPRRGRRLRRHRGQPGALAARSSGMLLVGFQLGNSGVMMAAIRDVTPRSPTRAGDGPLRREQPARVRGRAGSRRRS